MSDKAAGEHEARRIKEHARRMFPSDQASQDQFTLGYLLSMLTVNLGPDNEPWPAEYWRGLGSELSAKGR